MNLKNIKCDGCAQELNESDDIVVCPICGTPQHRSCYEKNSACVNEQKHDSGFVWKSPFQEMDNQKTIICPICGETNNENAEKCKKCSAPLSNNAGRSAFGASDKNSERKGIFHSIEDMSGMDIDDDEDLPSLDDYIESRIKAIAPGITQQQRQEQLCGHEIGKTASFIGNNAASYIEKFRKKERQGKHTFNWGAFFFTPLWFFWRRLYKPGIIYMTISMILSILMSAPLEKLMTVYQSIIQSGAQNISPESFSLLRTSLIPVMALEFAMFAVQLVAGFTADGMYHKYCTQCLHDVDVMQRERSNSESLSYYLKHSSTGFLATLAAMVVYYFLPSVLSYFI